MGSKSIESSRVVCEKCGKRLLHRQSNGIWHFRFGRMKDDEGNFIGDSPVDMYIHGSIKMKCTRRSCNHWNVLNYIPFSSQSV